MADERKKHGWTALALLMTVFVVFYAASSGPAAFVLTLSEASEWAWALFSVCYLPFLFLPHPVSDGFESWVGWWTELAHMLQ